MKSIRLRANAKLNLSLDVTGRREDGYHLMDMVNRSVSLSDEIRIVRTPGVPFRIRTDRRYLPTGEKNLIWQAAAALGERTGTGMPEVFVDVKKNIPTQAGLGGGSADAAAALIGLDRLLGLGLTPEQLAETGLTLGADVPFCLSGGAARIRGIGEILEPFRDGTRYRLVIAMPGRGHSTGEYFRELDSGREFSHPDTDLVVANLKKGKLVSALAGAANVFESAVPDETTSALKNILRKKDCLYCAMTGTGAAVFGVFTDAGKASMAEQALKEAGLSVWQASPCERGVDILEYRTD